MYGLDSGMTSEVSVKKLKARHYMEIVYPLQSHKHHGKVHLTKARILNLLLFVSIMLELQSTFNRIGVTIRLHSL